MNALVLTPRVLAIGGSDSCGGAGVEADIKTITRLGGHAMTAITAITVQDSQAVHEVSLTHPDLVVRAIQVVFDDLGVDAIKIGMLGSTHMVAAIIAALRNHADKTPIVLDPVMISSSGRHLIDLAGIAKLRDELLPMAMLLTPNLDEAAALTGSTLNTIDAIESAATSLQALGAKFVLIKGGHASGGTVVDVLAGPSGITRFVGSRISTRHSHGTGCTLASAIATGIASGLDMIPAIEQGRDFVRAALLAAPGYGTGAGPLGHSRAIFDNQVKPVN